MQKAIIIDIDGTITKDPLTIPEYMKMTREGKNIFYSKVAYYLPATMQDNKVVIELIKIYIKNGVIPLFVTAREEQDIVKNNTINYLKYTFNLNEPMLFMRPFNDFRPNYEIKEEIYLNNIKDKYEILFCLEDEEKNIEIFKKNGLQVLKIER